MLCAPRIVTQKRSRLCGDAVLCNTEQEDGGELAETTDVYVSQLLVLLPSLKSLDKEHISPTPPFCTPFPFATFSSIPPTLHISQYYGQQTVQERAIFVQWLKEQQRLSRSWEAATNASESLKTAARAI